MRNPTKTVISAYHHFNHITKMSLIDFCNKFTNIQIKFLMGYDIFSNYEVTQNDFDRIIKIIEEKKLVVGIHRTKKMKDIYDLLELPHDKIDNYILNKKIDVKYKSNDISNDFRKHIKKINSFDNSLYEKVLYA